MKYNYAKLNGRIIECYGTQRNFAEAMGISSEAMSKKMNNKTFWRQQDIDKACTLLEIAPIDIPAYFFVQEVQ